MVSGNTRFVELDKTRSRRLYIYYLEEATYSQLSLAKKR